MPQIQGINREQITFSNLESQIAKDNEIRFVNAFVVKLNLKTTRYIISWFNYYPKKVKATRIRKFAGRLHNTKPIFL